MTEEPFPLPLLPTQSGTTHPWAKIPLGAALADNRGTGCMASQ